MTKINAIQCNLSAKYIMMNTLYTPNHQYNSLLANLLNFSLANLIGRSFIFVQECTLEFECTSYNIHCILFDLCILECTNVKICMIRSKCPKEFNGNRLVLIKVLKIQNPDAYLLNKRVVTFYISKNLEFPYELRCTGGKFFKTDLVITYEISYQKQTTSL